MTVYLRPRSVEEALKARADHPTWRVLAGGTDALVAAARQPEPPGILDLFGLADLSTLTEPTPEVLRFGAAVTYAQVLGDPRVQTRLPLLHACAREVGALQIQNRGTLGGNLVTASPVGDTLPVWLALDATVEVGSVSGRRRLKIEQFITGYRQTALHPEELVLAVEVPLPLPEVTQFWRKVGTRRAQAISKVMVAAVGARGPGGTLAWARVAIGAVADRPLRLRQTEQVLTRAAFDEGLKVRIRSAVADDIAPIDDVRSTAAYRGRVAANLVVQFARELGGEVGG